MVGTSVLAASVDELLADAVGGELQAVGWVHQLGHLADGLVLVEEVLLDLLVDH